MRRNGWIEWDGKGWDSMEWMRKNEWDGRINGMKKDG